MLFRPKDIKLFEGQIILMCKNMPGHTIILIYSLLCYREHGTAPVLGQKYGRPRDMGISSQVTRSYWWLEREKITFLFRLNNTWPFGLLDFCVYWHFKQTYILLFYFERGEEAKCCEGGKLMPSPFDVRSVAGGQQCWQWYAEFSH